MSRVLGGIISVVGLVLASIAIYNIYFSEPLIGQIVIGACALVIAFAYAITLQENPHFQRVAVFVLMGISGLMLIPSIWFVFTGAQVNGLQIIVAIFGAVLLFVCWRMLPR